MKVSCVLVVSLFSFVLAAAPARAQQSSRVRALDELAHEALRRGVSDSALFRRLVTELEASDLVVHVVTTFVLPAGTIGTTRLSSSGSGYRYVRITIDTELSPEDRIAILGHELQHACEIARSSARDSQAVRALYQAIGRPVSNTRDAYETSAAIRVGTQVWFDVRHIQRRSTVGSQDR